MRGRKQERKIRRSMSSLQLKMSIDQETLDLLKAEKKVPYWFLDQNGKIERAVSKGWEFISSDRKTVKIGEQEVEKDPGKHITHLAGTNKRGEPIYYYLMAIPEKWWKQIQDEKEEYNKMVDESIRNGKPMGTKEHGINPAQGRTYASRIQYEP